jgi:hypothetical protein
LYHRKILDLVTLAQLGERTTEAIISISCGHPFDPGK